MDRNEIFGKAEEYAAKLTKSDLFVEMVNVKKQINDEFSELIKEFKLKREKFEESQKYSIINDGVKKIQLEFQEIKKELYSKDLVQKYFELERLIQAELSDVAKKLAKSISNRFN